MPIETMEPNQSKTGTDLPEHKVPDSLVRQISEVGEISDLRREVNRLEGDLAATRAENGRMERMLSVMVGQFIKTGQLNPDLMRKAGYQEMPDERDETGKLAL